RNLFHGNKGVTFQGHDRPLANGAVVLHETVAVGGVTRQAIFIHPPYQAQVGGETFVQYSVPIAPSGQFQFSVGIQDGASCNADGVTFRVTVNGAELYRQTFNPGAWHDGTVDLSKYANRTVRFRVISNPGPQSNPTCDWSAWSRLEVVYPSPE